MSHFMEVRTVLRNKASILAAAKKLGIKASENSAARGWNGKKVKGDIVLKGKRYDVALQKQEDGTYKAVYDEYGGYVNARFGENLSAFLQQYAVEEVRRLARINGYYVESERVDGEGNIQVELLEN